MRKALQNMEPVNGFEPLTCAFRVRLLGISNSPWSLLGLKIPLKPRLLRRRGNPKIFDSGEGAPKDKPIASSDRAVVKTGFLCRTSASQAEGRGFESPFPFQT